jgi:ribosomal protein S18 acetylase RimI-like enzyme
MGVVIAPFTLQSDLPPIIAAWRDAFAQPPGGPRSRHELADQLQWHGTFPGFIGLVARDDARDAVLGIVYGFSNRQGQWWRDQVAASLGPEGARTVLDDSFCLMELGVVRSARRQGIAALLVDALLARQPHPRAVLSMQSDNVSALAFYRATGWTVLLARMSFGLGFLPYDILMHPAPATDGHTSP